MKLIAALTSKNEDWIIEKTLSVLSKFCDKIIILDDSSEDNTENICKSFNKVEWHLRKKRNNIWERKEAEGLNECFHLAAKYNPEYILMLDADEIPTPNFVNFFNNIDKSINAWSVRFINLFKDEHHYRRDNFKTPSGVGITHDPFLKDGWRKTILLKYDNNFNYTYNFSVQKGGTSKYHPLPQNIPDVVKKTEEFYVIHYGKISEKYCSGEKDLFYAEIDSHSGKGSFENMLKHHKQCRTGSGPNGPQYVECPKEWFWN